MLNYLIGVLTFFILLPNLIYSINDRALNMGESFPIIIINIIISFSYIYIYNWNHYFVIGSLLITTICIIFAFNTDDEFIITASSYIPILLVFSLWFILKGIPIILSFFIKNNKISSSEISSSEISSEELDLSSIKSSLEDIVNSFINVSKNVEIQSLQLQDSANRLLNEVQSKENELQILNNKIQKVTNELQHYRALSEISEKEAKAIVTSLNQVKLTGRVISFFFGILSALVGRWLSEMIFN